MYRLGPIRLPCPFLRQTDLVHDICHGARGILLSCAASRKESANSVSVIPRCRLAFALLLRLRSLGRRLFPCQLLMQIFSTEGRDGESQADGDRHEDR